MMHRKLLWQLVPSFLLITIAALVAVTTYASSVFGNFYLEQLRREMRLFTEGVSAQVQQELEGPPAEIDVLCKELGQVGDGHIRVTVILPSGTVVGDSDENPRRMEDHSNRPEIITALREDWGWALRNSPTLGTRMLYVACTIREGGEPRAVVRTAIVTRDIEAALQRFYIKMMWCGLFIALVAAVWSWWIARRISQPIAGMQEIAKRFAEGELSLRVPIANSEELGSLGQALNGMARQLHDRIGTITRQRNEVEAILSSMVEGVIAVDGAGRIASVNRAAAELLGIEGEQAQGRTVEEVVRDVDLQGFVRKILSGQRPEEGHVALPIDGGRFFHVHGARLSEAEAVRSGAVIVLHDITRIHRLENIRRDFVANVSHELKTPITSIKGFVEALLDGDMGDVDQVTYYLQIVEKHADRLNAIIDDLLILSRLEEDVDQRHLSLVVEPLRPILESAVELSCIKAQEKNIRLELNCDDKIEAHVNGPLLEQALVNLISNAIKYSEAESIILIGAARKDQGIEVTVSDSGCGISSEHMPRLFERFYVVDRGRSRKLGGTGLGLAIVKHIAQVHGATVHVASKPGQGSTFTIHLPSAQIAR